MNSRPVLARRLAAPGLLLLALSFALVGCTQGTDSAEEGPITSRMNALYGGNDQLRTSANQYEELVAACMKEKGFEYTPMTLDDDAFSFATPDAEDWDPVADAEENGYWITPADKEALLVQYGLDEGRVVEEGPFPADDPNGIYRNSLSPSDQAAYDEALMGTPLDDAADYDWTTAGCAGEAGNAAFGPQMEAQDAKQDSAVMDDFYSYTEEKVRDDPRMLEANAAWASCMADEGYAFASPEEARTSIQQRYDDRTGVDSTGDDWTDRPDPSQISDEEIVALHADEVATATADARCTVDVDLYGIQEAVYLDAEIEFYDSHKTEVDAFFDAQEALLSRKD